MNRIDVLEQVVMCRRCDLYTVGHGPLPFAGPSDAVFAVLGEAPNREEDDKGHHFLGAAGAHLERALVASGLELDRAFILNAASCFPDGPPSTGQVASCRTNMHDQLAISGTGPVLLVGTTALRSFRSDLSLAKSHGHVFCQQGRVFFPTFHPALRNKLPQIEADLERFVRVVRSGGGWASHILDQCVSCELAEDEMEAEHLDDEGLLYCQDCWPRSPGGQAAKRAKKGHGVPRPLGLRVPATPDEPMVGALPSDPMDTAAEAAYAIFPVSGIQRRTILDRIAQLGEHGATDEELQLGLEMRYSSVNPRRNELVRGGWVEDSGRRRDTTTESAAAVWVLTTKGRNEYKIVAVREEEAVALVKASFPGAVVVDA